MTSGTLFIHYTMSTKLLEASRVTYRSVDVTDNLLVFPSLAPLLFIVKQ